jgi:outer membrane beta-barrel protein
MGSSRFLAATAAWLTCSVAAAQDTVDIGVLKDTDVQVVQNLLYPKEGRLEIGGHLGWMPFDPLLTTPNGQLSIDKHFSDQLALSVLVGGGYGLKTLKYVELESPAYGVSPAAYRYLASALVGVSYAPIYAKMSLGGAKVVHFDIYGTLHAGATLESSVIPDGGITVAPTVALGVGMRFFVRDDLAVRLALRDDLLVEYRDITGSWHFKQNAGITLGVTWFTTKGGRR